MNCAHSEEHNVAPLIQSHDLEHSEQGLEDVVETGLIKVGILDDHASTDEVGRAMLIS